ncbi:hypothetical protein GA0070604_4056 [Micromonospora eburnea]|uniref:Uncharacterized protein n=1 Tax=Micromonospora eburnea TaxID=227316 RepID=A0A1C6UZI1_9ACTN|nr:hypothetical protein GA0070604_4056 [Micromonospora eburnea]
MQRLATDAGPVHRPGPQADPKFAALKADVTGKQKVMSAHPPAKAEAGKAQGAAKPPPDDMETQGKAANAEKMNAAKPGEFDKAAFVKAVNDAIAAQAPKNLDEADKFADSGKADAVKGQVQGRVGEGKKASARAIETTTKAPPDTSKAREKQVTPLVADRPPGAPGTPDPVKAVPDKAPAAATDFSAGPKQVDQQMADAQVTEEQLAKSNEPEFTGALKEKKEGEKHAATAPGEVRAAEARTLAGAKAAAGQAGAAAMAELAVDRKQSGAQVSAGKEGAKSADEQKRVQVTARLQKVFDATKKEVEDILTGLDKKVDDLFTTGEKEARDAFTADYKRRIDAYKDKRYSGVNFWKWGKDKLFGLPSEVNVFYEQARKGYVDRMQQVISGVADVIGAELTRAKQRIAKGRDDLQAEVKKLGPDLQAIGKEAAAEFAGKFDELTESVDAKGKELVNTLATKYNEALKAVDQEIAAEKEKNKGLVAKAIHAVGGVIKTIMQLKDMLLGVLAKAAQAVMAIIKDPIGFLGNLVSAVGTGLKQFIANIGEHLKKGLVGWLLGAMAGAGLELPAKFDLRGIIMMIGSLLGLTWGAIRARIVQRGVPEQAMGAVEQSVPIAQKIQAQGIGGIWEDIKAQVGDLKANLFGKISEYLIPTVLIAGITWIISLLNPASAFIKACKMIIDFVMFIVNQGAQIIEFVNAVLDAIIAIAGGGAGGVPALIEKALARSVPVLIGALAAILGIGGIANKVKSFFKALSKPVMKAVDWIVGKIVKLGKAIWAKLKAAGKKVKDKITGKGKDKKGPGRDDDSQAPAKDVAPVSRPFAMKSMPHTLTGSIVNGRAQIVMASTPGDLLTKAKVARKAQHEAGNADAAKALDGFIGKYDDEPAKLAKSKSKKKDEKLTALLKSMAEDLAVIGHSFDLKDLTADAARLKIEEIQKAMPARVDAFIKDVHELWLLRYILRVPQGPEEGAPALWGRADLAGTDTDAREHVMKPEFIEPLLTYFTPGSGQRVDTNKFFDYAFKRGGRDAILTKLGTPVPEALKKAGVARASALEDSDYKKALLKQLNELGPSAFNVVVTPFGQLALPKIREGEHSDFAPVEIKTETKNGTTTTTYKTKAGKTFTVIEKDTQRTETLTVTGEDLRLKTGGGPRGVTHDSPGFIPGMFMNRAHGVGDRFGGSGFATGLNIVSTSDRYNKISQAAQERAIAAAMTDFAKECGRPVSDVSMTLTVVVHFGELMTTLEDRIKAMSWFKAGDADAERKLKAIMEILRDPPVRIVKETEYRYVLTCGDRSTGATVFAGSDDWLFIEKVGRSSGS